MLTSIALFLVLRSLDEPDKPAPPPHLIASTKVTQAPPDRVVAGAGASRQQELPTPGRSTLTDMPTTQEPLTEIPETRVVASPFPGAPVSDDVVLSANRLESFLDRFGGSVSVLGRDSLRSSQQSSVAEVLRQIPGVDIVQNGGIGRNTAIFLRGGDSNFTKVMLDGIPLNDPSNPGRAFSFGDLFLDNLERIEVLRGPQSVLYGSDAMSGVVNLYTARGEGPTKVRLRGMAGSFATWQESAYVTGGNDKFHYAFGGGYFSTNGFTAAAKQFGNNEPDGYRNGTFSIRTGATPTRNLRVDFVGRYINAATDIDGFTDRPADDPGRQNTNEYFYGRTQGTWAMFDGQVDHRIGASVSNINRTDNNPGFFGDAVFHGLTRRVDWQTNALLLENNRATIGIDYQQEEADTSSLALQRLWSRGVYVQDQFTLFEDWHSTVGGRWDEYAQAGDAFTWRAVTLYRLPGPQTALKASYGTAFIAPSIFDLFGGFAPNPNLEPEESEGWEVGVEQPLCQRDVVLGATYFRQNYENLISFGPPPDFQAVNIARANAKGIELTAQWNVNSKTTVTGTYTLTDTLDYSTDLPLVRRPKHKVGAWIRRRFLYDKGEIGVGMRWVRDRLDFDQNFAQSPLEDFAVVDMTARYDLSDRTRVFARVDNLFNENYEETFGFSTPRVSMYGGIELTFGPRPSRAVTGDAAIGGNAL